MIYKRNRLSYAVMTVVVIILGLGSRKMFNFIPDLLNTYLGDALWALMIFLALGFVFREMKTKLVAIIGILFCYLIELSQLYHANWIDTIRNTTIGGLTLGYGFLLSDLLAYTIGIGAGVTIEILIKVIKKGVRYE
ncbi:DUF2809 domain-containing protein [Clostridium frigoris]|uniref:DUF2809 domain-containing protein n=1 Tax=Clostridium frigoris TaxID=205327 RepID=A0ABS6BVM1_9CLOT|nr:DUF2809 domain-containing protein [Clostridium frigoris]MBU3160976.1 DUF2809 domain-containing protein [Clostridium frigoris]